MSFMVTGVAPLLQVYDMTASLAFYRDRLGFELVGSSPEVDSSEGRFSHWCWLRLGGADIMLNTAHDEGERPPEREADREAAHADTILFFGCEDCDAIYAELRGLGVELDPPVTAPYGMRQLNLRDPDGFGICFQHPA